MSPEATVQCPCKKAVIIIRKGRGVCSACGETYLLDMRVAPKPFETKARVAAV